MVFLGMQKVMYSSPTNVSKGFGVHRFQGYKRKKKGRSNLLLSSDAFNQSGKDVDTMFLRLVVLRYVLANWLS